MIITKPFSSKKGRAAWIAKTKKKYPFATFSVWEKDGKFWGQMVNG